MTNPDSGRKHPLRRRVKRPKLPAGVRADNSSAPLRSGSTPLEGFATRLHELCESVELSVPASCLEPVSEYLRRMLQANQKLNLSGIRDPDDALVLHALDSLHVYAAIDIAPKRIVDLGSGNGFPGIAAAALWPDAECLLVERTLKKARAIEECLDGLGLKARVVAKDAGQLPSLETALRGRCDLVVSRAMASLAKTNELAAPLLSPGRASVVHFKAARVADAERREGDRAARKSSLAARGDLVYVLPGPEPRVRRLVVYGRL